MDEQTQRLADQVYATICENEQEFLRAEGTAVLTVAKLGDRPRIALDSRRMLISIAGAERPAGAARFTGEVRQLAHDVRRAMLADHVLVSIARVVVITIQLQGSRPSFELSYKGQRV
jgi:hypothetical protein